MVPSCASMQKLPSGPMFANVPGGSRYTKDKYRSNEYKWYLLFQGTQMVPSGAGYAKGTW